MDTRWGRAILIALVLWAGFAVAQSREPRVTPLGTQMPAATAPLEPEKGQAPILEDIDVVLGRVVEAYGGRQAFASVRDCIASGKLTLFAAQGAKSTVDVTLILKDATQVQRIVRQSGGELRQGSDGKTSWESFNGLTVPVRGGLVGSFIESQTMRSVSTLLDAQARGFAVRDGGMKGDARDLEVEIRDGGKPARTTKYSVDKGTSRVTRIEWVTGEVRTLFGAVVPATEAYVLSDFRPVQGVPTPFRVERYVNGIRIEETRFTSVRYNTAVKDDVFKP